MADDITLNSGSGGDTIAADDIGPGVKYQRVKLTLGADGTNDGDVASANPIPAKLTDGTNAVTVDPSGAGIYGLAVVLYDGTNNSPIGQAANPVYVTQTASGVDRVEGDVQHGLPDATGNWPVKIGGQATSSEPTAVDVNDRVNAYFDVNGYQHVKIHDDGDSHTVDNAGLTGLNGAIDQIGNAEPTNAVLAGGTDGSFLYGLKTDANGELQIDVLSSALPTGAATETTLSTLNGKVTACNTGAVTVSAALPAGTNAIGKLAANDGVDIGDVTVNNAVGSGVYIRPGTGVNLNTSAVGVTSTVPGTGPTNLGKAVDSAAGLTDTGVAALVQRVDTPTTLTPASGDYVRLRTDSVGRLWVNASTVAHDDPDSGNPVKVGLKAIAHGAVTAVLAGDRTNWYANRDGVPFVMGGHPNVQCVTQLWTADNTDEIQVSVGAGAKFVVTSVVALASNGNANDADVSVEFDDTTDVPICQHPGIPPGGGFTWGNGGGILAIGGDGQDILVSVLNLGSGDEVSVTVTGYEIDS